MSRRERFVAIALVFLALGVMTVPVAAQAFPGAAPVPAEPPATWEEALRALWRLPLAALLASILALRPRRRGTPPRDLAVIHSQIILAVVGVLVMLVVGTSLARAFGIVGAAGLVRYRAKVNDPKDAGVMLSTLAIGLATGVGQWPLAIVGTVFLVVLLAVIESFEPAATRELVITVKATDPVVMKPRLERVLRREATSFEIKAMSPEELQYEVQWPVDRPTDGLSERIVGMDPKRSADVAIEHVKDK
ncbi:hypothetical protein LuPra_01207 [Luteitalea pratensis]|uniref:DUF4956 domain-containing protein n=1 Tax=Luteitalea pratensis TaxID=1855912 RepID=A0A143PJS3_LUTPR|nr:DUF4956 domain-containing protein [Luteitalea pratensis]AMY08019.1 hypothetical protein LuPra_01207 [Luteitalea pratensis]